MLAKSAEKILNKYNIKSKEVKNDFGNISKRSKRSDFGDKVIKLSKKYIKENVGYKEIINSLTDDLKEYKKDEKYFKWYLRQTFITLQINLKEYKKRNP